ELARRMEFDARGSDLELKFVDREDRVGRGGDHSPFARRGIPAIRLTETLEHYGRQHSDQDLPEHVCFQTVAQVGGILGCTAAGLSLAGDPPPAELAPGQALSARIRIDSDSRTEVWIRPTDQVCWTEKRVGEPGEEVLLEGISPDDFFIGVSAPGGVPTVLNP
ncbi:MAG: hypothetical protein MH204_10260, partial [Fimbriimonadaceae bacterium]|nr:hypothetical protein [Fimbriimonadaceae bacterium]